LREELHPAAKSRSAMDIIEDTFIAGVLIHYKDTLGIVKEA
jgi:hypothetical protein